MATKKTAAKKSIMGAEEKPVALTLKIDSKTYVRLSTLKAKQRRTHQDILREALEDYLKRQRI